jgi:hypothetical protein
LFEAAFISYAVFLALAMLFVLVVFTIIGVKALIDFTRRHRQNNAETGRARSEREPP